MDKVNRVDVDLVKNVMQIHAVAGAGRVVTQGDCARTVRSWFANLEPCLVAMEEACSAAHY